MAKKSARIIVNMQCNECKHQNYTTQKNRLNDTERLRLAKFCSHCKKVTEHMELKK